MDFISLILCTLCIVLITTVVSKMYQLYVIRQKLKNIPQLSGIPFIGISFQLIKMLDHERMRWLLSTTKTFKDGIFIHWIGSQPFINLYKPEYLETIFPSTVNITKGKPYDMVRPWLGNGLLTSTGAQWFHDRKLIGPTFHFNILEQFAMIFSEKAEILTKYLEREIDKNPRKAIDIFPLSINLTLDIICETAMGVNLQTQKAGTKYASSVQRVSRLILSRIIQPWYYLDWIYYLTPEGREFKQALKVLKEFTTRVIDNKKFTRQLQNDKSKNVDDGFDIDKPKRKAFLDLLLDQNEKDVTPLTNEELRAQVDTFMFEGHDTTAVSITWALFCLGNDLEYQEKVHEELEEVFKDSKIPASLKELPQLKCLERAIKESLRLYPSVPQISRQLVEDVKIGNYILPKDVTVSLSIILTHRNANVWPNPLKFDPDRFLPENSKHRNPYAFIPFSAGPRNCIGQRFALIEEKIVLTAILRKWRVKSVKTHDTILFGGSIILRPHESVFLHFTPKK